MNEASWLFDHGLLQTTATAVGLFATVYTLRKGVQERKIQNLFTLNSAYRDIWKQIYDDPSLALVMKLTVDLKENPVTVKERVFVQFIILHSRASYKARKAGMDFDDDAMAADLQQFFSRPIPNAVWQWSKGFQDHDFVEFVDSLLIKSEGIDSL